MTPVFHASESHVPTDADRICRVRRCLYHAESYQEFQNAIMSATVMAIKELYPKGARDKCRDDLSIAEIRKLAALDTTSSIAVGRAYATYLPGLRANSVHAKTDALKILKDAAQSDMKVLEMLERNGIDEGRLEEMFDEHRYGCMKREESPAQMKLWEEVDQAP